MARKRFLAYSCPHEPIVNRGWFNWLIGKIEEHKPDYIVCLGDLYEGKAAKRWPAWSDEKWTLEDEHRAVVQHIEAVNSAGRDAIKYWLYGNHDENLFGNAPDRIHEDLKDAIQWRNHALVSVALSSWRVVAQYGHRVRLRLGPLTFQHGVDITSGLAREGQLAAYYGTPYGLYIRGHTHKPLPVSRVEWGQFPLPYWFANPGTGADWKRMHYMDRCSMARWGRGCIIGEASGIEQRRSAYGSKQWSAETLIHSMAIDE